MIKDSIESEEPHVTVKYLQRTLEDIAIKCKRYVTLVKASKMESRGKTRLDKERYKLLTREVVNNLYIILPY